MQTTIGDHHTCMGSDSGCWQTSRFKIEFKIGPFQARECFKNVVHHCSSPHAYIICKHTCFKMLAYFTSPTRMAAQPSGGTSVLTIPEFTIWPRDCQPGDAAHVAHVPAGPAKTVARARVRSPGRALHAMVVLLPPAGCSTGAQKGPSSMGQFSPAEGAIGILHVALTPSWSHGLPRPPCQLDMERVKAIFPVGQSQMPSTHALWIGI